MPHAAQTDDAQIKRTYSQLTFLGVVLHTVQFIIYYNLAFTIPTVYNGISVAFYILMTYMTRREKYSIAVCAIHMESCLFAVVCVVSCGWGTGGGLFLLAMSSLVYICPFKHKFIPYVFSLTELTIFIALRIYTYYYQPIYGRLPDLLEMLYYVLNSLGCFYIILFAAFSSNISAMVTNIRLRSENRSLSAIANSDFLTGLPSRRAFLHRVKGLSPDVPVIAAIGDLDNFKSINDIFGHSSGDYVLRTVGNLIGSAQSSHLIPCRWGGEEFVILFYDCSKLDAIARLEELRGRIEAHSFEHDEQVMNVTITFGAYPGMMREGAEQLIDQADKYLYQGKQRGKNCVVSP